jgi:hypothetical protein
MRNNLTRFYVYRHIRLDNNTPFYVGKGQGNRVDDFKKRNRYWNHIKKITNIETEIILDNLTEEQAFQKEIEFIKLYKDLGYCEANLTLGGEGGSGMIVSSETRKKLSKINKGLPSRMTLEQRKKHSEKMKGNKHSLGFKPSLETRKKLSELRKNKKCKEETREKISLANKGKKRSDSFRKLISEKLKGRKLSQEVCKKISDSKKGKSSPKCYKKIKCLETEEIFDSVSHASKKLNITLTNISAALTGKRKKAGGYTFIYYKD